MAILQPKTFARPQRPELVLGIVSAVGTPLTHLLGRIADALSTRGYETTQIRLSGLLDHFAMPTPPASPSALEHERLNTLMSRGNELRRLLGGGDALALFAASEIHRHRPAEEPQFLDGHAFILRQLKHPDELTALRLIYGAAFQLIAVYCPEDVRVSHLHHIKNIPADEAKALVERDRGEDFELGQQLTKTFHRADAFVSLDGTEQEDFAEAESQVQRYLDLLFGEHPLSPNKDEYGMYFAHAAGLRSADLSRQVGAAILDPHGDLVSVGTNEVPAPGGGQYWNEDEQDARDWKRGRDPNVEITFEAVDEVIAALGLEADTETVAERLRRTRLMNLTEFGRAVHAEMEAILAAGRKGTTVRDATLYTTTFPCHNCAKHIVDVGIRRVVYIEPYPKSLVDRLHDDAVVLAEARAEAAPAGSGSRVEFSPFTGISPNLYPMVFSILSHEGARLRHKDSSGFLKKDPWGLRRFERPLHYIDRERAASLALSARVNQSMAKGEE